MKCFVTGCAGFIGSNLVKRLLAEGFKVNGIDNFSTGNEKYLLPIISHPQFQLTRADILNDKALTTSMRGSDIVFHLAANADVRFGLSNPSRDLEQNTIATFKVLEAMRANQVQKLVFSSTGSIYGEAKQSPTPEDASFPVQTSLYGASKLACEGMIQAYSEGFGIQANIYRFVSILGEHYSHGHVIDFFNQLKLTPDTLNVLGNGFQTKSYLYVQDCIDAILLSLSESSHRLNIFNLGTDEVCTVKDSIGWICEYLKLKPKVHYSAEDRGWVGDNPHIFLDCSKIRALGWKPRLTIKESVFKTIEYLSHV